MNITINMVMDIFESKNPGLYVQIEKSIRINQIKLLHPKSTPDDNSSIYICKGKNEIRLLNNEYILAHIRSKTNEHLLLEKIFNDILSVFLVLKDWEMALNLSRIKKDSLQEMFDLSEQVLANPITFVDPSLKLIAYTRSNHKGDEIYETVLDKGYLSYDAVSKLDAAGCFKELDESNFIYVSKERSGLVYPLVVSKVKCEEMHQGYLTMLCTNIELHGGLAEIFQIFNECIATRMKDESDFERINRFMSEFFLMDLLQGKVKDQNEIEERLHYIDLPLRGTFFMLVAELGLDKIPLGNYLVRRISEKLPLEKTFLFNKKIVVLLIGKGKYQTEDEYLNSINLRIMDILNDEHICAGISQKFELISLVHDAYYQALSIANIGMQINTSKNFILLGIHKEYDDNKLYLFKSYAPYIISNQNEKAISPKSLIHPSIKCMIKDDKEHKSTNLNLLYVFLQNERSFSATSKALQMHRNNVIYHIQRIEDHYRLQLSDSIQRNHLIVSFFILEMMQQSEVLQLAN